MKRYPFIFSLFLTVFFLSGCAAAPLIPLLFSGAGAAYQGYTVWKGTESSKYYSHDYQMTCDAVKKSVDKLGLEKVALNLASDKACYIETKGNNPLQIDVAPVEKTVSKVTIKVTLMGDKQFAEFVYKNIDDLLVKTEPGQRTQPVPVAAKAPGSNKRYHGLCFGSYAKKGPAPGPPMAENLLRLLIGRIAPYTEWIRTYSTTHGMEKIPELARQQVPPLKVAAGAWLDGQSTGVPPSANQEIKNLITLAREGKVDIALVGNEATTKGVSVDILLEHIRYVKEQLKGYPVHVASGLSWVEAQNTRIVSACDVVFFNIYPCFAPLSVDKALENLMLAYDYLKVLYKDKEVIIGETGWPSSGAPNGPAVYNLASAVKFQNDTVAWARSQGIKYFYFEAFDEAMNGGSESSFGIWDSGFNPKPGMMPQL